MVAEPVSFHYTHVVSKSDLLLINLHGFYQKKQVSASAFVIINPI